MKPIICCTLIVFALTGCTSHWFDPPPPSTAKNPPIYSDAQQVQSEDMTVPGGKGKQISYEAAAEASAVLDFYKDALVKDGWSIENYTTPEPDSLHFYWVQGCPFYELDVKVTPMVAQQSKVEIKVAERGCY